ncbi:MAG TPA: hypothetical protein VMW32_03520 [Bacteroidales bacterium]|nr:hypothetical protein [Bacteroidales bacterium]
MKTILKVFFLVIIVLLFSCEELGTLIVNCSDCITVEPLNAKMEIMINSGNHCPVYLNIYEGDIGDSVLYSSFVTCASETMKMVPLNKKYTVSATYYINGVKYISVDSTTPRVKFEEVQCKEPCYYIYNRRINLRLKTVK